MRNKMNTLNKYLLLFFTSFFLFLSFTSGILHYYSNHYDWIYRNIAESNYVHTKGEEMLKEFNSILRINGFEEPILDELIDENELSIKTYEYMDHIFFDKKNEYNLFELNNKISLSANDYIERHHIRYNNELKKEISKFIFDIDEEYIKNIKIPYLSEIKSILDLTNIYTKYIFIFSFISFILSIILILFLYKDAFIQNFLIIFGSVFLMLYTFPFYLIHFGKYHTLEIYPKSFYIWIIKCIDTLVYSFVDFSYFLSIPILLLFIIKIFGYLKSRNFGSSLTNVGKI